MLNLSQDIRSLTDFKRKTSEMVEMIRETGRPVVLTVNGRAEIVVQDAQSYQKLLDLVDQAEAIQGIRRGLEQMKRGEGRSARKAFSAMRRKYAIPR